ncbi:MAG: hypothetical protein KatS3mg131_2401 [Candidatus Tectimicrobiota bacterium]|nr:MAG: hypothetical protein KatS3mg131_2401 [Candidatus Tectomicrobia bacterium]
MDCTKPMDRSLIHDVILECLLLGLVCFLWLH